jgi:glutathione S-transferase
MLAVIAADVHERVDATDEQYFRESMEKVLKMTLEDARKARAEAMARLNRTLEPMQALLKRQPWIAGAQPAYADYIVFSLFQWARIMSPDEVLEAGVLRDWREKVLDLHSGYARGVAVA